MIVTKKHRIKMTTNFCIRSLHLLHRWHKKNKNILLQLHEFQIRQSKNAQREKNIYDNSNSIHTGQCTDSHRGSAYIPFPHLWLCDAEDWYCSTHLTRLLEAQIGMHSFVTTIKADFLGILLFGLLAIHQSVDICVHIFKWTCKYIAENQKRTQTHARTHARIPPHTQ